LKREKSEYKNFLSEQGKFILRTFSKTKEKRKEKRSKKEKKKELICILI
jgi:hypothetical protein